MPHSLEQGLTPELYKTILAIVDDRVREIRVAREEFEDLKQVVRELAQAQVRTDHSLNRLVEKVEELAEAQKRTEARVEELAEAQKRTEARVEELAEAQKRTEARLEELAEAQKRTEARIEELAEAQKRTEARVQELAEAQKRTEARVEELAEAQKRTEARLEELAEAQKRTEARVEELAEAQKKTEIKLATLTDEHRKTREMLGGLSHTVGYRLEDEAIWALPQLLKRDFGMKIETPLVRTFLETARNHYMEVNIWGSGVINGRRMAILGEAKTQLKKHDVDEFLKTIAKVREISRMEIFPVLVTYQASPKVRQAAEEKGIKIYFSYELRLPQ